jgi:hypothetical protein
MKGHCFVTSDRTGLLKRLEEWMLRHVSPDRLQRYSEIELMDAAVRSGRALGIRNLRLVEGGRKGGNADPLFRAAGGIVGPAPDARLAGRLPAAGSEDVHQVLRAPLRGDLPIATPSLAVFLRGCRGENKSDNDAGEAAQ